MFRWFPALTMALVSMTAVAEEDHRNRAGDRLLPEGEGLAKAYPGDRGLSADPSVIFADAFADREALKGDWDEARNEDTVLALVDGGADGGHALLVTATLGENTGGGLTVWFSSADSLFIRFYTKFDEARCDYVHHFATLRANHGLQGKDRWSGFGGAGLKPAGDERFSTALEPWGNWGKWKAPGKWNFYSYWHEMKASPDGKYWGNGFRPREQETIAKGRWICTEFMLKHNTPGKRDGEQAYWIDGKLKGHWQGISWRESPTLMANAFTLESYVTDRWTKQKVNVVFFDNVVIARRYIGPISAIK